MKFESEEYENLMIKIYMNQIRFYPMVNDATLPQEGLETRKVLPLQGVSRPHPPI